MGDHGFTFPGGVEVALPHALVVALQVTVFWLKVFVMCGFLVLVRWSLPRFRYDQLMRFAWRFLLPLALANLVVTVVAVWLLEGAA
jgi:NADH-quinone oxidoreductase subunit H